VDKKLKPRPLDAIPLLVIVALSIWPILPNSSEIAGFTVITPCERMSFNGDVDTLLIIESAIGEVEIHIKHGSARIVRSECPHQICVRTGEVRRPGSSIICAPGRVAVIVEGSGEFDAVTR